MGSPASHVVSASQDARSSEMVWRWRTAGRCTSPQGAAPCEEVRVDVLCYVCVNTMEKKKDDKIDTVIRC